MIPAIQGETARFLETLAGRPPVETHISAVFIGAETAWKLKKAVTLPFLDFAPPHQRRHFAQREFALNRAMAPEIYLALHSVIRAADGGLRFGPAAAPEALDWVLEMAAIPPGDFLDVHAARQGVAPELCRALGDLVARLHEAAPVARPETDAAERLSALVLGIVENAAGAGLAADAVRRWQAGMRAQLAAQAGRLRARAAAGRVRRVHGDLHLGNLCLWRGAVLPFDALEFDEALATIDTGYDLAFLLMDLELRAGRAAANSVFNRYMAHTGDLSLLPLLPLFLSLRAMIRAQVRGLQKDPGYEPYMRAALAYLAPVASPVVAVGGLQGTGKTTLARALAPDLGPAPGALVLRSDELRKRLHHVAPETRLPAEAYSPAGNARLNEAFLAAAGAAAASGHGLVLDASFLAATLRAEAEQTIRQAGRAWLGLWLEAPLAVLTARLARRRGDASDADAAVLRKAARQDAGQIVWHRLDAQDRAQAEAAALALIRQLAV